MTVGDRKRGLRASRFVAALLASAALAEGAAAEVSPSHETPEDVRQAAIAITEARYADFGPTLAAEKLRELHDIKVGQ